LDCLSGGLSLHGLGEVRAHEALKVKVGELVLLLELKKSGKLGIGVNLATILLVLEIVGADVGIDVASHGGARHLGALVLTKERGKLIADASGLHETTGGTVAGLALALGALLLGSLKLTLPLLLKTLILRLKGRNKGGKLLELSIELGGLLKDGGLKGINLGGGDGLNGGNNNRGGGSGLNGLGLLGGLGGLRGRGGGIHNRSGLNRGIGRRLRLTSSHHSILYLGD